MNESEEWQRGMQFQNEAIFISELQKAQGQRATKRGRKTK
jgi:hypothetical protein